MRPLQRIEGSSSFVLPLERRLTSVTGRCRSELNEPCSLPEEEKANALKESQPDNHASSLAPPDRLDRTEYFLMQNKRIKLSIIFLLLTGAVAFAPQQYLTARANTSGAPVKFTGAPGEQTCLTCHGGAAVNSAGGVFMLTGLPADYSANQQISLALTISKLQGQSFGFQATALDDAGNPAGTIIMTPGVNTTILSSDPATGRQYISQSAPGSGPTGGNIGSWTFSWRAPAQKVGRV